MIATLKAARSIGSFDVDVIDNNEIIFRCYVIIKSVWNFSRFPLIKTISAHVNVVEFLSFDIDFTNVSTPASQTSKQNSFSSKWKVHQLAFELLTWNKVYKDAHTHAHTYSIATLLRLFHSASHNHRLNVSKTKLKRRHFVCRSRHRKHNNFPFYSPRELSHFPLPSLCTKKVATTQTVSLILSIYQFYTSLIILLWCFLVSCKQAAGIKEEV